MNQRQKQIRAFLVEKFGADKEETLFARQEETLNRLIDNQTGKSKSQKKTLAETILPSIALYKALQGALPQDKAYACRNIWWRRLRRRSMHPLRKWRLCRGFTRCTAGFSCG